MIAARQIFLGRGGGAKLPYDAEVEYLESTGTQYINTGVVATNSHGFSIDIATAQKEGATNTRIFGAHEGNTRCGFALYGLNESQDFFFGWNEAQGYTANLPQRFVVSLNYKNDRSAIFNGTTYLSQLGTLGNMTQPIYLLNANYNNAPFSGQFTIGRLYGAKITIGSDVAHEYIPVRFTNELGQSEGAMYDRVSGQLFRNKGTGSFLYGGDVYSVPVETSQYVQDGLVAMWDGKENFGVGKRCDTATSWVDLTGNHVLSYEFTPTFTDNAFELPGTDKVAYCESNLWRDAVNANQCTVEICFKGYSCGGNNSILALNYSLTSSIERAWWFWGGGAFAYRLTTGSTWSESTILPVRGENDAMTISFPVADCYKNGTIVKSGTAGASTVASKVLTIGRIANLKSTINGYDSMMAHIHSLRIYNKVLTAAEIAANYAVDKARFNLP